MLSLLLRRFKDYSSNCYIKTYIGIQNLKLDFFELLGTRKKLAFFFNEMNIYVLITFFVY